MFPSQMRHNHAATMQEVTHSATEILNLAREIVQNGHMERKFIVFPLFIAGFVNDRPAERQEIMGLLKKLENDSIGRNFRATRQLLEIVYERKDKLSSQLHVLDWEQNLSVRPVDGQRQTAGNPAAEWGYGSQGGGEDVDWVGMIGELGLQVVNCRL